ncbi:hypothetical protein [Opitutus terrae]|uniref:Muconolactone isomerase domain-containing protein n=1 Tax=Opitutus terrae (strain DSM 11246 / JCM 15787 / PB90-1) TaxID=452637 RepID=B1ZNP1_OPITP|nr:hypothetical protein [Opitutus terrae]ACB75411.1 hypothetical protein Oter_2128 [Opitutus terrae PB90-1]
MKQISPSPTSTHEYLVEMTFSPFATLPSPAELVAFTERFALPTLEALQQLRDAGRIAAGGSALAAGGFIFVARADSPDQLEQMVAGLPSWPRAQTRVVPLGSFASRAATVRQRLAQARARAADAGATTTD